MAQIAYPQAETEPAADRHPYTDHQLSQADQIETFREEQTEALHKEQIEALRDESGVIDYRHYLNKAHHLRSGFWWGLFRKVSFKSTKGLQE
ncbi:hypothetical protein [Oceanospirillum beijerinckii]|uniref:hypothetical protein n=1 Tax=Oceanospirillum beijerinckii TaxID=64976 RepID=UPI0004068224|nr:hypothetical protein [Oceanospirillum beijerinckii]